jgi:hypothetical protein
VPRAVRGLQNERRAPQAPASGHMKPRLSLWPWPHSTHAAESSQPTICSSSTVAWDAYRSMRRSIRAQRRKDGPQVEAHQQGLPGPWCCPAARCGTSWSGEGIPSRAHPRCRTRHTGRKAHVRSGPGRICCCSVRRRVQCAGPTCMRPGRDRADGRVRAPYLPGAVGQTQKRSPAAIMPYANVSLSPCQDEKSGQNEALGLPGASRRARGLGTAIRVPEYSTGARNVTVPSAPRGLAGSPASYRTVHCGTLAPLCLATAASQTTELSAAQAVHCPYLSEVARQQLGPHGSVHIEPGGSDEAAPMTGLVDHHLSALKASGWKGLGADVEDARDLRPKDTSRQGSVGDYGAAIRVRASVRSLKRRSAWR